MRVNSKGQLEVNKAQSVERIVGNEEESAARIQMLVDRVNELIDVLKAAKLMRR